MSHGLTVVITRDVEPRYRGFLRSAMIEISAGVYVSATLNSTARDRLWEVVARWHHALQRGCIVMTWRNAASHGNISVNILGESKKYFENVDGMLLTRKISHSK